MAIFEQYKRKVNEVRDNIKASPSGKPSYEQLIMLYDLMYYMHGDFPEEKNYVLNVTDYIKDWCNARKIDEKHERLYWDTLLLQAPWNFESYLLFMERDRVFEKKFYEPRMKTLKVVAKDLQDLEERKIKFYGLSMPSRVGKSTICIFFLSWIMGKRPNSHNAMGGHSGKLAKGFYSELLNLICTKEYTFSEIFPGVQLERKSADDFEINFNEPDRFATITCRGIEGTWTGAIDISQDGYLYTDDLVRDREHSLSPIRLENTYQDYLNKMVDRKNDGARELMVGTRWSTMDPLGKIRAQYKDDPMYRFRKIPALDENGESNFDYAVNGFSTSYYADMKAKLDRNEWMAKYMQEPFVREGLLFPADYLRFYNGVLPEGDGRNVSACDVAWGGGDSLSMPIGKEYENGDVYIYDWIFNKGKKETTLPIVCGKIIGNGIRQINFEANNGGDMYCMYISEMLGKQKYKCSCSHSRAPGRMEKMSKIIAASGDIIRRFVFLDKEHRSEEYQAAMDEMEVIVTVGVNEHDDSVDSLAQLVMFIDSPPPKPTEIIGSPI